MPKIEVEYDRLMGFIGTTMNEAELETTLEAAKGEIDEPTDAEGVMKVELNDTNRPDLWSTAGLGRQLRIYLGGRVPSYPFFSTAQTTRDAGDHRVVVDPGLRETRPYLAAFAVSGRAIDDGELRDLIQTQEKLTTNFGQHRKAIAMGVYRTRLIQFPVQYRAVDPATTAFVPLGETRTMDLRTILREHPKGQDYGSIVASFERFPFLEDSNGEVLSFPPVINSARVGAVEVGDQELFIELTGTDLESVLLACSIAACDLADAGHTIHPVAIEYPYETPLGRTIVTPFAFQEPISTTLEYVTRLLGETLGGDEAVAALRAMGVPATVDGSALLVQPPEYRNDFLHPVDVVEDVAVGHGMSRFTPEMPRDFTVGRLTDAEQFNRRTISIMVGLGFQEMVFPNMGAGREFITKMRPFPLADAGDPPAPTELPAAMRPIRLANPMSENYEYVRSSIVPQLLGAESVSANAVYPHHIFEVGKVAVHDESDVQGTRTVNALAFVSADASAGFTLAGSHVRALFYYLNVEYELRAAHDERFIPGRSASIVARGPDATEHEVGVLGELDPQVLENNGIQVPATAVEIDLDAVRACRG